MFVFGSVLFVFSLPYGAYRHMGWSVDSSAGCVCVCVCVCMCVCVWACPAAGCLLVIHVYTPKRASKASVLVHAQLYVICGLGAGTCKIMRASIAAEALGHCDS